MAINTPFDPTRYYRLSNSLLGPNYTVAVVPNNPPDLPNIFPIRTGSSENWQLFYDGGVYFIRNYVYGSKYQLGVTKDNASVPQLLATDSSLGMQWNLTQDGGNWLIRNMLLGQGDLMGISADSLEHTSLIMNTASNGAQWEVDINISAGTINETMLSPFASIQVYR
jgi:hypothetical protein